MSPARTALAVLYIALLAVALWSVAALIIAIYATYLSALEWFAILAGAAL